VEISDYINVLRRRWRLVVAVALAVVALAGAATWLMTPQYTARSELYVSTVSGENATDLFQGSTFTQRQVATYANVATTPYVLSPVIDDLGLESTPAELASRITVQNPPNTVLLEIAVTDPDPQRALDVAAAVSDRVVIALAELDEVSDSGQSPVKATVVSPAVVGTSPVSPQPVRNLALGAVLGLLLGLGLALVRDLMDTSVRGEESLRGTTDAPVLAGITYDPEAAAAPTLVLDNPHHTHSEAFRTLRTNLQFVNGGEPPRSVVMTSSLPEEGKTTTTAHLALTLAAGGKRVCVVEADLRRPRLLDYLGLEGSAGLTNVLIGEASLDDMLQPFGQTTLSLLGSGPIPPNPAEMLSSDRMRALVADLEQRFDIVLYDAPPLLPVTDAAVLSSMTDGALMVVGVGVIKKEHLRRATERLEQAQGTLLGLILNRLPSKGADGYYTYDGDYTPDLAVTRTAQRGNPSSSLR
jgi:polysaccharide biosynthesis transport protein